MVQLFIDDVMCFVDVNKKHVYSAKLKKLKGQKLERHLYPHYMIKYNGKKRYLSLETLLRLANEKLQSQIK